MFILNSEDKLFREAWENVAFHPSFLTEIGLWKYWGRQQAVINFSFYKAEFSLAVYQEMREIWEAVNSVACHHPNCFP